MENRVQSGLSLSLWALLFVVATVAVLAASYAYYRAEVERIQQAKYEEVAAIGKLKAGQIGQWRQNQLEDVGAVVKGPMFKRAINEWLRDPIKAVADKDLTDRLVTIQQARGYVDASLLDLNGNVLLSATGQPEPMNATEEKAVQYAVENGSPVLTDLHRTPTGAISMTAAALLPDPEGRPVAVVLLRSNPESLLFPLIHSWPTPSSTAETLLVRRDGEDILFLNHLRHQPNPALSVRESVTRSERPAVQAVLGKTGIFLGNDYRGVEVLADLRAIPNSPWFMVAKVDASEILAEARYRGGMVALFAVLSIVLAAGVTAYGYRYRQVRLYRDLYHSEQEQQAALREFRTTLYSIGDAVITTDTEGRIKQMNPTAERLTGWCEAEAQGKPISGVFRIVNEERRFEVEDPVARVLREGAVIGLANHTLLIAKDGSEHPIVDSGAPILDEDGATIGVVLVFQDQTEERRQVRERETRLALLQMLNEHTDTRDLIRNITVFLQERSGCEAVGVRLKEGDDFPYFETRGLSQGFVRAESSLCQRDLNGQIMRDSLRNPVLECMCGNVLCGRFDPSLPFFTAKGSFWSNSTTELLASTTEADRQARTRNRCNGEGYESVALFRLRSGDETIGLLQLNDRSKSRFTPELLDFMESTADEIAMALAQRQAQARLRDNEERYRSLFNNMLEGFAYCKMLFEDGQPQDFIYLDVNDAFRRLTGLENVIGRKVSEVIPGIRESNRELFEVYGRVALTGKPAKLEAYVEPLGIWFSVSVYSTEREHFVAVFDNITERKQAEQALQESEERFRILADGAFEGVAISRDGVILDSNHVFCQMSGHTLEELVGTNIRDLVAPEFRDISMTHVLTGSDEAYESGLVRKDGQVVPALVKGKVIPYDGGTARIASVRDISALRKAEEVQRRLAIAIEQSAEAVLITDTNGIIQYVNPAVERNSGFSRHDLLGKTPRIFQSGEHDKTFYRQLWDTINVGNIWSGRFVNKRRDGTLFQEDATISPVRNASGEITNFVAVKRDITEHLELSNQLFQAQKMEAVGTLAGGVAHDFNNLLQVVLGYSELILFDENLPSRFRDDLGKINHAARNGADLVQRLLTFSRKTEVRPRPLNLNRQIEQFQKMLSRTIPKMIEIDLMLADELLPINADPLQIEQILMNLALNARDAMPEGGRLVIETGNTNLEEQYCKTHLEAMPGRYVLLSVSDTGQGMDKETLQHIFEPFFTTKKPGEGTGLGLAMVYGIVKQHGGRIICYSEPAEGTTFKLYFPAMVSGEELQRTQPKTLPSGGSETVLIVDDEDMVRDLAARILTKSGYKAITAANGREALDVYRARQDEIALVILDLIMPEMGGKQCLKALLNLDPSAKVIIASGYSASDSIKDALSSGARGFINKPYDIRQVLEVVRSVLDEDVGTESV